MKLLVKYTIEILKITATEKYYSLKHKQTFDDKISNNLFRIIFFKKKLYFIIVFSFLSTVKIDKILSDKFISYYLRVVHPLIFSFSNWIVKSMNVQ